MKSLGPIFWDLFVNNLTMTLLFPFAAAMVRSFNVTEDEAQLGYYAGYLGSAYFGGALLTSTFWGALSDRIGRKPVLLVGLGANLIFAALFGCSKTLSFAVAMRFLNGLFSTIIATGRSSVAELCDDSNQAKGFAYVGTCFGFGLFVGPVLGGFLCLPAEKYPAIFPPGSFFDNYPFLLPCLILSFFSAIGIVTTVFLVPETKGRAQNVSRHEPAADREDVEGAENGGVKAPLLPKPEDGGEGSEAPERTWAKFFHVLFVRDTLVSALLYCLLGFVSVLFNEVRLSYQ
jgi:MFS family permease